MSGLVSLILAHIFQTGSKGCGLFSALVSQSVWDNDLMGLIYN
jgi:hypothetical protein